MIIGGLQKFSLSDFPGQSAAVIFARGCNFRCGYCHNGNLIPRHPIFEDDLDEKDVLRFLAGRKGVLGGIVICGGEPTLQPDLIRILEKLRDMGFRTKLDTNGSRPDVIQSAFDKNLLDFVAMDVKAPWQKYGILCGVQPVIADLKKSVRLIVESGIQYEFRTTRVMPLLSESDIDDIRHQLPVGANYRIQEFRPENALDPRFALTQ